MLKNVVCPVSSKQIDSNASRMTALICAAGLAVYIVTGFVPLIALIALDYLVRAAGLARLSPVRALAAAALSAAKVQPKPTGEAPKLFASRVGFLFAAAALVLAVAAPPMAVIPAAILCLFAVLDGALDFCVGCLTYHHVVFPFLGRPRVSD
jgi:hypothetical protein